MEDEHRQWMRTQLTQIARLAEHAEPFPGEYVGDPVARKALMRKEPTLRQILKALDPSLEQKLNLDQMAGEAIAQNLISQALGILDDMDEWDVHLKPEGPKLQADQLHPWVWEPAKPLWDSAHYRQAVNDAATTINAHIQTKVGRRDKADVDLINNVMGPDNRKPGQVYLAIPGELADKTVRSRNNALRDFAAGCFAGIRNVAAHESGPDWDPQYALECLASLSVLARWVDEAQVFHAT